MGKFTRIDYFLKFLQDDETLDIEELRTLFPDSYEFMYCTYDMLREKGIQSNDILSANYDPANLSIGIECSNKSVAKRFDKTKDKHIDGCINVLLCDIKTKKNFIFFMFSYVDEDVYNYERDE